MSIYSRVSVTLNDHNFVRILLLLKYSWYMFNVTQSASTLTYHKMLLIVVIHGPRIEK